MIAVGHAAAARKAAAVTNIRNHVIAALARLAQA